MRKRIVFFAAAMGFMYIFLIARLGHVISDEEVIKASAGKGTFSVDITRHEGYIYDRNMTPLVNREASYTALINPDTFDLEEIYPNIADMDKFNANASGNAPFLCKLKTGDINDPMTPVTEVMLRYSDDQPARHIIGYDSDSGGCGIDGLYSDFIKSHSTVTRVTYSVNAMGNVLDGADIIISDGTENTGGVVLSIDSKLQEICERAMDKIPRGAVVVMDVKTGDIIASVSRPVYDTNDLADYIDRDDAPFVNRAFSAYSAGSVFKTVIAAAALEHGISEEFSVKCTGKTHVGSQEFNCHYWAGHGILDMRQAMKESCNPYFIRLGENIPVNMLEEFIKSCGFGQEYDLGGIISQSGYVPDAAELAVPAEKANICFGQGKLTVTPLQVCRYICAVANGGFLPSPRLIWGTVESNDETLRPDSDFTKIMSAETAAKLKSFMFDVLYKENSVGIPTNTDGGGKTSTAQTGRFDENGKEEMTCWFAGFFPYNEPEYAVAIVAEDGVSGNLTCAPVFKEIVDRINLRR